MMVAPWLTLQEWRATIDGTPANVPVLLRPAATLDIDLVWRVETPPQGAYQVQAQLRHVLGREVFQAEIPLAVEEVHDGVVQQHITFALPEKLPEGAYTLVLMVFRATSPSAAVLPVGTALTIPRFKVPLDQAEDIPPAGEPLARFGDAVTLVGLDVPEEARVFDSVVVRARWQVEQPLAADWMGVLSLVGPCEDAACSAPTVTEIEERPLRGLYPTTVWSPGESVVTTMQVAVPPIAVAGDYQLRFFWRETESNERITAEALTATVEIEDGVLRLPLRVLGEESEESQ